MKHGLTPPQGACGRQMPSTSITGKTMIRRFLSITILTIGLTACGFHLRGSYHLPEGLHSLKLALPPGSALEAPLRKDLDTAGVDIGDAGYTLRVLKEKLSKQTSNTDSRAKVAEYTFLYDLRYEFRDDEGRPVSPEYKLLLRRSYQYDTTAIVGKSEEEETLLRELYQEAAHQIVQRLSWFHPDAPAPGASP